MGPAKWSVSVATILSRTQLARVAAALILMSAAEVRAGLQVIARLLVTNSDPNGR